MHNQHDWITLYQDGGYQVVCRKCGLAGPWKRAGERGSNPVCVSVGLLASAFAAFFAWLIFREWGQVPADVAALVVFVGAFWGLLRMVCKDKPEEPWVAMMFDGRQK
jgi:hypothetical protein